jgi:hypothetical protein
MSRKLAHLNMRLAQVEQSSTKSLQRPFARAVCNPVKDAWRDSSFQFESATVEKANRIDMLRT